MSDRSGPSDTVVLVQARMTSTRLPGKVLMPIGDRPMVVRVLERAAAMGARTILTTSTDPSDDELADVAARHGWEVSRGELDDVLDRSVRALPRGALYVVRVTADCPLLDPRIGRTLIAAVRGGSVDYASNVVPPTFPDGLDCEAFTAAALRRAWEEATLPSHREFTTPYIREHPELFTQWNLVHVPDLSDHRWTVDDERDLELVRAIYQRLPSDADGATSMYAALAILERDPGLRALNAGTRRNEGAERAHARDREHLAARRKRDGSG
jgi:spore coat polysaccharide biosynthesis protein SpsF (cytidylyltransferase family)